MKCLEREQQAACNKSVLGDIVQELPIVGVLGRTIAFVVVNLWTLFRLTWLPLSLLLATQIGQIYLMLRQVGDVPFASVNGVYTFFWFVWTSTILQTIAFTAVAVQVHRVVLFNERRPGHYFSFPFGWTEVRYVVMGILSSIFLFVPISIAAYAYYAYKMNVVEAAMVALIAAPSVPLTPAQGMINIAIIAVVVIFMIWLTLRLSLWPPAVVANNRLALGDAWRTTRGNVLPLLLMFIVGYILLAVVLAIIQVAFVMYAPMEFAVPGATPKNPKMKDVFANAYGALLGPNAILMQFITQFVTTTTAVAILSFAYKALKGADIENPTEGHSRQDEDAPH